MRRRGTVMAVRSRRWTTIVWICGKEAGGQRSRQACACVRARKHERGKAARWLAGGCDASCRPCSLHRHLPCILRDVLGCGKWTCGPNTPCLPRHLMLQQESDAADACVCYLRLGINTQWRTCRSSRSPRSPGLPLCCMHRTWDASHSIARAQGQLGAQQGCQAVRQAVSV